MEKSIRELFGIDYLLSKVQPEPESDKLWDKVVWQADAIQLNDAILKRIRDTIKDRVKDYCWKSNSAKITKADVLRALHDLNLDQFSDPED